MTIADDESGGPMAKTRSKTGKVTRQTATADKSSMHRDASTERPPESAEDFGHVLRRLIGARDAQSERDDGIRRDTDGLR
jgi:hypothetical protein